MASLADRIDIERIDAEARRIDIGRGVLTLIAALFYALGWLLGKAVLVTVTAVAWSIAAARIGWQDAHKPGMRPRRVGPA